MLPPTLLLMRAGAPPQGRGSADDRPSRFFGLPGAVFVTQGRVSRL